MTTLLDLLSGNQTPQTGYSDDVGNLTNRIQALLGAKQPSNPGMAGDALSGRFDTSYGDYAQGVVNSALGKPQLGPQVAQERLLNTGSIGDKLAQMQYYQTLGTLGRGEGNIAAQRIMQENPGMSYTDAYLLATAKQGQGITYDQGSGTIVPRTGAPQAAGAMAYGKEAGQQQAEVQSAAPKAKNTELGKISAENQQSAVGAQDVAGLYDKLIQDAKTTPSGALESIAANVANKLNMPTQGSIAQAKFDADLNNLYLGTIRSLKGTGRIMEAELNQIAKAAPNPSDSNEVKIAKAQAHMAYYQNRMRELGFDPVTGQPVNGDSGTPQLPLPQGGPVNLVGASDQLPDGITDQDLAEYKQLRGIQ